MSEEWGPWIEHDGKGCPCVGEFVHVRFDRAATFNEGRSGRLVAGGHEYVGIADGGASWRRVAGYGHIIRYRIRKPRALIQLIEMVENLPAPTERVDA